MLRDRHQLHVREAEFPYVGGQLGGELAVAEARPPGRQVDLVDGERRLVDRAVAPVGHPVRVLPLVARGRDHRGRGGRHLRVAGHRVGPLGVRPVGPADVVLVDGTLADTREEELPDTGGAERAHGEGRAVPVVEVARDPDPACVRRPDREAGARHALVLHGLRAERLPELLVRPSPIRCRSSSPMAGRNRYGSSTSIVLSS